MGYVMAILSTLALTYLGTQPEIHRFIQKYLDIPGLLLAVPFSIGSGFMWTLVGLCLGSVYVLGSFDQKAGALLAPSWAFLLLMAAIAWLPLPVLWLFGRRYWWIWGGMSLIFVVLFGWVMPLLAES
jgi:hypothetical protein